MKSDVLREGVQELVEVMGAVSVIVEVIRDGTDKGLRISAEGSLGRRYFDFVLFSCNLYNDAFIK